MAKDKKDTQKPLKVLLIGDAGVGKTSLLEQFQYNKFQENQRPTIGADFVKKQIELDGRSVVLQIWDTAGQERYQSLCSSFYRGADCCIIVYDVTSEQSYYNCQRWLEQFRSTTKQDTPIVLVGNKIDLGRSKVTAEHVNEDWLQKALCKSHLLASALDSDKVQQIFLEVSRLAITFQQSDDIGLRNRFYTSERTNTEQDIRKQPGVHLG